MRYIRKRVSRLKSTKAQYNAEKGSRQGHNCETSESKGQRKDSNKKRTNDMKNWEWHQTSQQQRCKLEDSEVCLQHNH